MHEPISHILGWFPKMLVVGLCVVAVACSEGEAARFSGHSGAINALNISPSGAMIASASEDGTVRLWSPDGKLLDTLAAHSGGAGAVAFSPDERLVASGANGRLDRSVKLWDPRSGALMASLGDEHGAARSLLFLSEGRELFVGGPEGNARLYDIELAAALRDYDTACFAATAPAESSVIFVAFMDSVRMLDRDTGEERGRLDGGGMIIAMDVTPDGSRLVTGGVDGSIRLWAVADGSPMVSVAAHKGGVTGVALTADASRAVSGGEDGRVFLWDLASGERIKKFKGHDGGVNCVALAPDGASAVTGGADGIVKVWNLEKSGEEQAGFRPIAAKAGKEAWVSTGEDAISQETDVRESTSNASSTLEPSAVVVDSVKSLAQASAEVLVLDGHEAAVRSVTFSTDSRRVVACAGMELMLWDAAGGGELRRFKGHTGAVSSAVFSSGGRRIVSGGEDATLRIWDVDTGEAIRVIHAEAAHVISSVAISPDATTLLSGGLDRSVRLWDAESGGEIRRFEGHQDGVLSVAFSPDGRRAVSGGLDRTVRLWYVFSGREIRSIEISDDMGFVWGTAFSPDGLTALSGGSDKTVRLWNVKEGTETARFEGHEQMVRCVAFSPDGRRALSGGADGLVILWGIQPALEIARFKGHTDMVTSVAFSPDGLRAASGSADATARVWTLPE